MSRARVLAAYGVDPWREHQRRVREHPTGVPRGARTRDRSDRTAGPGASVPLVAAVPEATPAAADGPGRTVDVGGRLVAVPTAAEIAAQQRLLGLGG